MHLMKRLPFALVLLAGVALLLAACGTGATPTPVTVIETVEVPMESEGPSVEVPYLEAWLGSGHADSTAEAFRHWDEDDPVEVPTSCAKCHSEYGYLDFLGVDGTAAGVVDNPAPVDSVVSCVTCHNDATATMDSVVMPSGIELTGLGREARCMQCHQGRQSKLSVDTAIEEAGVDEDTVSEDLGFLNIHYYAAAATKYGTEAKGGYEYEGKTYDAFFVHAEGYDTCEDCHNPHTLELKVEECTACHVDLGDPKDLRMPGSLVDFDGDGDLTEGIYYEIVGLQEQLFAAIQAYAADVAGAPVVYDSVSYPYFFNDTNADGEASEDEANYGNRYVSWTPRMLKAAYNYQLSQKDPGGYAHGGKYVIQLLVDSLEDIGGDVSTIRRIDHGHFAGSEEAFRHWDEDDPAEVSSRCSRCHTAEGLPLFLTEGVEITLEPSNGFLCSTCHTNLADYALYEAGAVTFPSGASIDSEDPVMNLCMNCHQGRESGASVDARVAGLAPDGVSDSLSFVNVHYFPAGATIFGAEAGGGYEYAGRTYAGRFEHVPGFDTCGGCHDVHQLTVKADACTACHTTMEAGEVDTIRISEVDYDGDDDVTEGLAAEIDAMREVLYAAIQTYADGTGNPIIYAEAYPYFFADTNANGVADPGEGIYPNRYAAWTPKLLKAAYNYQYASKDPGAFAHNGAYTMQLLYDSIQDIGGSVTGFTRP
jgi:hypothetical protein